MNMGIKKRDDTMIISFLLRAAYAAVVLITQLLESQLLVQPQLPSSSYDE